MGERACCACSRCGWGCLDIFTLICPFFPLSPSLWETARYRLKYCLKGPLSPKPTNQPTTFNTPVLPKQYKVAFLRVSVDPYIPNTLRCYACQVIGHHENKCHREKICANCGEPEHSADETDCKRPPKCFNCKEDHPANSRQCQAWHTEKEILEVKYTMNKSIPEARKIVESYTAALGKSIVC